MTVMTLRLRCDCYVACTVSLTISWTARSASCLSRIGWVFLWFHYVKWLLLLALPVVHCAMLLTLTTASISSTTTSGLKLTSTMRVNTTSYHNRTNTGPSNVTVAITTKSDHGSITDSDRRSGYPHRFAAYPRFIEEIRSRHRELSK